MKLFLDANVLISAVTRRELAARRVLDSSASLFSNEYCIKDLRRALFEMGYSPGQVNRAVDDIRLRVRIQPTPQSTDYGRIILRDKSDAPVVYGAMQLGAVLVTDDFKTFTDAKKYVQSMRSGEVK